MKYLLSALLLAASSCFAQDWSIRIASGSMMTFPSLCNNISAEVSYKVSPLFTFAADAEMICDDESNVTAMLKTTAISHINICTGIGVGHKFTTRQTDHTFHTYSIGAEIYKDIDSRYRLSVIPMCEWRTYSAHIGFMREFFRLAFQFGITYKF